MRSLSCLILALGYAGTARSWFLEDPASLVNLFIGTANGGHVFPGANLPHGMVKVGMDTDSPGNQAGYDADPQYNVTGFSQLHDSGTGGGISLSNFKIFPLLTCEQDYFEYCKTSLESRKVLRNLLPDGTPDDYAQPGYFSSNLSTGVRVELTASRRAALHRYTFPSTFPSNVSANPNTNANSTYIHPRIVVDVTNDGSQTSTFPLMTINTTTKRVTGGAQFQASFGPGRYTLYMCADFQVPGVDSVGAGVEEYGAWLGDYPVRWTENVEQMYYGFRDELGALLTFPANTTMVLTRVGVSYISTAQACSNAEEEIPDSGSGWDFEGVKNTAYETWNELLGRIQVDPTGVDQETVALFYSSVSDFHTGENPLWNSTEPYYDSLYCNWDTYRTLYPLYALHAPVEFARIVRGFINIQQHEGWLPECRGATQKQYIQGGSNGDPILGEFWVKFYKYAAALNVSGTDLYNALLADAEVQPPNWDLEGRQVNVWKSLGWIPQDGYEPSGTNSKQVSRTLEHAFGDFAISQVAELLGKTEDAAKYAQRSGNFANVWNANITVPGGPLYVVGMMQPRFMNGTFNYTDPRHCSVNDPTQSTCYLNAANHDGFYESSPLVYVPHDTARLIEMQGGLENFINRLNFIIDQHYFDETDEPSQQIPFMYHYANAPGYSTQSSRQVISEYFNTSINGLPGNDDSGAMGSYAAFYLAGMYPLPATRQFLLSSPYFPQISFYNPTFNTTTTVIAHGFEGNPANGTGGNVFVRNVTVNGQPWHSSCYIEWDAFEQGATIELQLTDNINVTCGADSSALPPSLSTGGYGDLNYDLGMGA
ncbi:glycoside hydrolase family 92 protein [Heliocybe sulcata]|uniref:Glycoside hydrolase family 92 protein n=1 Tax=Heliocybe sulcata TaxID=5364 RepID=A0A5C3ND53_9AGAM|nr:glycoside hydrolase family 92 protein [Heliocybe sulcata]